MATLGKDRQEATAHTIISTLIASDFWGEVQFKFEKGNVVHIRVIRNTKIDDEANKLVGKLNAIVANGNLDILTE